MEIIKKAKKRTIEEDKQLTQKVGEIIDAVRTKGDEAVALYNNYFEKNSRKTFRVSAEEIKEAYTQVKEEEIIAMKKAAKNIRVFAEAQKDALRAIDNIQTIEGASLGHRVIPIDACGCYVPGGNYPLYSTALMLIIPAKVAGVKRVVATSPAMKDTTKIHPKTLVAMDIAGADEIYAVGGVHIVAAMAYGTEQIKPVDLIVGPGNQYVSEAKRQCYGQVGIDFVAGPSEVLIIADETASPKILAADLLAQSEHDFLAKGILITTSKEIGEATITQVEEQLKTLSTKEVAEKSWADYGEVLLVENMDQAVKISNEYAPEHLEIITKEDDQLIPKLYNYGSLFIAQETGEVFGDYASGTNHTLPTMRAARYTGGVWAGTFLKVCTHQKMTKKAMREIAPLVADMAQGEELEGHKKAALVRLELK